MSEINKPEGTDPVTPEEVTSEADAISKRIAETRDKQNANGTLESLVPEPEANVEPSGGTKDVATQESSSKDNVNADSVALSLIETSTGRKFNNIGEAEKFLTNLNSLVGDQNIAKAREAQEVLTNLSKKFGKTDVKELETYFTNLVLEQIQEKTVEKTQAEPAKVGTDPEFLTRLEQLEHSNQLLALEKKYPDASEVSNEVALIAKAKGVSYIEAFESSPLKNLIELKAKEESAKNPIVTPSNRVTADYKKVQELAGKAKSGSASEAEKLELTKQVLGI